MESLEFSRLAVFIDESYQLREKMRPDTFYFLCAVFLEDVDLRARRQELLAIAGSDNWHSTDELKTEIGVAKFEKMCHWIANNANGKIYVQVPIQQNDRLGESARAVLIRELLSDVEGKSIYLTPRYVYEQRLKGDQTAADVRTISELKRLGRVRPDLDFRPRLKNEEPLLWLSDVVASAYRRKFLFSDDRFWPILASAIQVSK